MSGNGISALVQRTMDVKLKRVIVNKPLRYLLYATMIGSLYYSYHMLDTSEQKLTYARVMNVSLKKTFNKDQALMTVRFLEDGNLAQFWISEQQARSCNIYDTATVKVVPSMSRRFTHYELVSCFAH